MVAWCRGLTRVPVKDKTAGSNPVATAKILPGTEDIKIMWKDLQKRFGSSESLISLALGLAVVLMLGSLVYNYFTNRSGLVSQNNQTNSTTTNGSTSLPTKHTVIRGETLWTISEKYYNTGYNWVDIQRANNLTDADGIEVGQALDIPVATPMISTTPASQVTPVITATPVPTATVATTGTVGTVTGGATGTVGAKKTYKVVSGDSLWKIAVAQYQDGYKWSEIAKANNLRNPDLIYPDTVLTLP